jgi:steroid delta-isomerase-like uncharacterized protein
MDESVRTRAEELQREYTETVWNRGEVDGADEHFADGVVVHDVPQAADYEGRDAFKQWVQEIRTAFPDFEVDVEGVVVGDDAIVARWVARGTNEGELSAFGMPPTGESVEWSGVTVYEMEGEEIVEAWWYYDMLGLLTQLGTIPEAPMA